MHSTSSRAFRVAGMFCLALLAFSLATGAFAQSATAPTGGEKTALAMVRDVAQTPPYVFLLLVGCSVFTCALILERWMYYRKTLGSTETMVTKIKQAGTPAKGLAAIEEAPGVAGRVFRLALTAARDGYPPEQVEQLVQGEVTKELISMEKFLPQLDSMVTLCPLIGLLGTTVGMIRSFSIVAAIGI